MTTKHLFTHLLLLLSLLQPCYATGKLALVIGNSDYAEAPLNNPTHDSHDMAQALRSLGFDVIERENQNQEGMNTAVREFGDRLHDGMIGIFYFAGHGMQVKGKNYLIPVQSGIQREDEVPYRAFDVNQLLAKMESAHNGLNLVVLDACRNNPFERSFRSGEEGLAPMDAPTGTLIAYAAKPGTKSKDSDASGNNGLYTGTLLKYIHTMPQLKIEELLKKVRIDVKKASGEQQVTWEEGGLENDFCFSVCTASPSPPTPNPQQQEVSFWDGIKARFKQITGIDPQSQQEASFWDSIKASTDPADFAAYLKRYPKGLYAELAQNAIKRLDAEAEKACDSCPKMIRLPEGDFMMGSGDGDPEADKNEKPRHPVHIKAFAIGKYEVTVSQFSEFANETGYVAEATVAFPVDDAWRDAFVNYDKKYKQGQNHPVVEVSFQDAQTYIQWLNKKTGRRYRLPTEAEWEYAARAGTNSIRFWGDDPDQACEYGNVMDKFAKSKQFTGQPNKKTHACTDKNIFTSPVGSFKPNPFGLYDILGNAWELTCSAYNEQGQARQDFSRKLKWDPSDFSGEKFSWRLLPSAARVRPAPAAVHNSPSVRCAPLPYANDLTPCRDGFAC